MAYGSAIERDRFVEKRSLRCAGQAGVTLVELLVGLSIVALAAALVVLNAPPARPPARTLAQEMAARVLAARDAALLSGAVHRLEVIDGDYRISRYAGDDNWAVVNDWRRPADEGVSVTIIVDDPSERNALGLNGGSAGASGLLPRTGFSLDDDEEEDIETAKNETAEIVILDPLGPSAAFQARFTSRRSAWRVDHSVIGEIGVARE